MKKLPIFLLLLFTSFAIQAQNGTAPIDNQKLIEASQAGAMPVFFDVNAGDIPKVEPGNRSFINEYFLRGGLPNFFNKAIKGQPLKIGFIGGSITRADEMYRIQAARYIQSMFPDSKMVGINAGIAGTGADLGACRLNEQLLVHQPDLVFVEFAVNGAYAQGVEGIVRQIRAFNPYIDICLLYTISGGQAELYFKGEIPPSIQKLEQVAAHYQLTSIHFGASIGFLQNERKLIWKSKAGVKKDQIVFSNDGVHPTQEGGNLYAAAIARAFESFKKTGSNNLKKYSLKAALLQDNWEDANMLDPLKSAIFSKGWDKINPAETNYLNKFKEWFPYILKGSTSDDEFRFKFNGDMFGFFDVGGPESGQIEVFIDSNAEKCLAEKPEYISNRFNANCDNRYRGQFIKYRVSAGEHVVRVKISGKVVNKKEILSPNSVDIIEHPEKYNQSVFYLGKILIKGNSLSL